MKRRSWLSTVSALAVACLGSAASGPASRRTTGSAFFSFFTFFSA